MAERPILFSGPMVRAILEGRKTQTRRVVRGGGPVALADVAKRCPYWADTLWVRETWANIAISGYNPTYFYRADGDQLPPADARAADNRWRPSIYMPRAASRITLCVTGVRVERLQAISEADAAAEGIEFEYPALDEPATAGGEWFRPGRHGFKKLWDSINEKRGFGWDANPLVWVVDFIPLR